MDRIDRTDHPYTVGVWMVKAGNEDAFIRAWAAFARWTVDNVPGAREARLLQDMDRPQWFISLGPWDDADSIDAWRQRPRARGLHHPGPKHL